MANIIKPVPKDQFMPWVWTEWFELIRKFIQDSTWTGDTVKGSMTLPPLAGRPSNRTEGQIAMIYTTGGSADARTATPRPMYTDGTDWRLFVDDTVWTG